MERASNEQKTKNGGSNIMSGNYIQGLKAANTNKTKEPDFYKRIGAIGGKAKVPKGFALMTAEQRSAAGRAGGTKSRRKAKKQ